ncbi:MAG TPA: GH3 auxin-responsive promoter family protein, partial [Gaiellaceae bacterium]|nr:GH3 auxin-responsive promoter family protein [Gaiellaceae bacterium]
MSKTPTAQRLLRTWLKFSAASNFDDATWTPREAQEKKLLEIVGRNKDTAYGRDHGFAGITSIEDYRSA